MAIGFRQLHGDAQRAAARNNRHFVQRIGMRQQRRDDGVAGLVVRARAPLVSLMVSDLRSAPIRILSRARSKSSGARSAVVANREQRRLVHEVGDLGA
jgi:hypothetical protein